MFVLLVRRDVGCFETLALLHTVTSIGHLVSRVVMLDREVGPMDRAMMAMMQALQPNIVFSSALDKSDITLFAHETVIDSDDFEISVDPRFGKHTLFPFPPLREHTVTGSNLVAIVSAVQEHTTRTRTQAVVAAARDAFLEPCEVVWLDTVVDALDGADDEATLHTMGPKYKCVLFTSSSTKEQVREGLMLAVSTRTPFAFVHLDRPFAVTPLLVHDPTTLGERTNWIETIPKMSQSLGSKIELTDPSTILDLATRYNYHTMQRVVGNERTVTTSLGRPSPYMYLPSHPSIPNLYKASPVHPFYWCVDSGVNLVELMRNKLHPRDGTLLVLTKFGVVVSDLFWESLVLEEDTEYKTSGRHVVSIADEVVVWRAGPDPEPENTRVRKILDRAITLGKVPIIRPKPLNVELESSAPKVMSASAQTLLIVLGSLVILLLVIVSVGQTIRLRRMQSSQNALEDAFTRALTSA